MLAFLVASPGAKLAQRVFRHKTTKQPFADSLNAIVWLHVFLAVCAAAMFVIPETRVWMIDQLSWFVSGNSGGTKTPEVTVNRGL